MTSRQEGADEILIVGGGPTGLLLALALDHAGLPSTVLDPEPPDAVAAAPFDGRALALMYGSKLVVEAFGAWPALAADACPVLGVRVRDEGTGATVAYDAGEVGDHPCGYGIENRVLRRTLLALARQRPGIGLVAPARLERLERRGPGLAAITSDGRARVAGLVVGADGRQSAVRALAGIPSERVRYGQTAITFAVRHARPHRHLVQEFLRPAGPLALLPLGRDLSAVTWIERDGDARQFLDAGPAALHQALAVRLPPDALGEFEIVGAPRGHPLSTRHARRCVAPNTALVGDAAHGVHPIHAQGFNLAVRDVATLAEVVADAVRAGQGSGDSEVLLRYERARRADVRLIVAMTDGLNSLFSNDLAPAKAVRRLGLALLDRLPPVKRLAMRRGMGLGIASGTPGSA